MKRTILGAGALALAAALFSMGNAQADVPGCTDVTIGVVCAQGDPLGQTGEVYADGNSDNPEPIDGYAGINSDEGVVACAEGDYDANRATDGDPTDDDNNVLTKIPPDPNSAPPSAEPGPCTPTP